MPSAPTIFVIDDDPGVRVSLRWLIESARMPVETFESCELFLSSNSGSRPGCIVLDVLMPGMGGMGLLTELGTWPIAPPVIIVTGHGTVALAAQAMRQGAVHVLEKPYGHEELLNAVREALARDRDNRQAHGHKKLIGSRLNLLTPREIEVMDRVVAGDSNKIIAARLHLTEKTIEAHRAKIMDKMQAQSLAELVRFVVSVRESKS